MSDWKGKDSFCEDWQPVMLADHAVTRTNATAVLTTDMNETSENITFNNYAFYLKLKEFMDNRAINDSALIGLLIAYVLLILTGAVGNGLVCLAVARKPQMRTARNVFIVNLAISDLILCLFTMPFSLVEIALKFWPLGELTCKLVGGLQATSIFVSTISITAIALDRYKVIIYPTQESCKPCNAILTLTMIWLVSLGLSFPLFWLRVVEYAGVPWIQDVQYCLEKWPVEYGAGYYSIFTMVFQYVLPIVIVSGAYARICRKLKYRMVTKGTKLQEKHERDKRRIKRTNSLLISIALIFGISWLPLNILNVVASFYFPFNEHSYKIIFACCHMVGMSSACSNPLLYGWLNDNFKKEFQEIFSACCSVVIFSRKKGTTVGDRTESVMLYTKTDLQQNSHVVETPDKFETIVVTCAK